MTHDELLDKIKNRSELEDCWMALQKVAELHKPFMYDGRFGQFERCSGCASEEEWLGEIYPCPTIQVIEKELRYD